MQDERLQELEERNERLFSMLGRYETFKETVKMQQIYTADSVFELLKYIAHGE